MVVTACSGDVTQSSNVQTSACSEYTAVASSVTLKDSFGWSINALYETNAGKSSIGDKRLLRLITVLLGRRDYSPVKESTLSEVLRCRVLGSRLFDIRQVHDVIFLDFTDLC